VRLAVVQFVGEADPRLVLHDSRGLLPLELPANLRTALENHCPDAIRRAAESGMRPPLPIESVQRWLPPVIDPRTFRDFYAFEQHVKTCRANRGLAMVPEWYKAPVFYFSNPTTLRGHNEPVCRPRSTRALDFELEVAAVIGQAVENAEGAEAESAIFGFTVLNDLSARDLQAEEMKCGLGPAKGKDFATVIGPGLVTIDELVKRRIAPGRYDLAMCARKNGREISRGNMRDMYFDFTQLICHASRDAALFPGDLIGSGTVGTGCILELRPENTSGWLEPGDVIELEIEHIGVLRTPII